MKATITYAIADIPYSKIELYETLKSDFDLNLNPEVDKIFYINKNGTLLEIVDKDLEEVRGLMPNPVSIVFEKQKKEKNDFPDIDLDDLMANDEGFESIVASACSEEEVFKYLVDISTKCLTREIPTNIDNFLKSKPYKLLFKELREWIVKFNAYSIDQEKRLANLEKELSTAENKRKTVEEIASTFRTKLSEKEEELQTINKLINQSQQEKKVLEEVVSQLKEANEKKQEEVARLTRQIDISSSTTSNQDSKVKELSSIISTLESGLKVKIDENLSLKNKLGNVNAEYDMLVKDLKNTEKTVETLKQTISENKQIYENGKLQLEKENAKLIEELKSQNINFEELRKNTVELKEYEKLKFEHSQCEAKLLSQNDTAKLKELAIKVNSLQQELRDKDNDYQNFIDYYEKSFIGDITNDMPFLPGQSFSLLGNNSNIIREFYTHLVNQAKEIFRGIFNPVKEFLDSNCFMVQSILQSEKYNKFGNRLVKIDPQKLENPATKEKLEAFTLFVQNMFNCFEA